MIFNTLARQKYICLKTFSLLVNIPIGILFTHVWLLLFSNILLNRILIKVPFKYPLEGCLSLLQMIDLYNENIDCEIKFQNKLFY